MRWPTFTINARAQRIEDPVGRLRYLRAAGSSRNRISPVRFRWALAVVPAVLFLSAGSVDWLPGAASKTIAPSPKRSAYSATIHTTPVWIVEQSPQHELLSSGLRIERSFEIATERRRYRLLPRTLPTTASPVAADTPRGIVFHTTESELAPFNEAAGKRIAVIGKGLLAYVQRHRAYHYVVDRFGRVFRVVAESDSAWHAGHAIWADDHWSYLDLNNEFLAIAVETNTDPTAETPPASEAQIRSLRLLTAFLRQKYGIHSQNCVTHAQVSVNPANRQIGWHTDWAANFPFEAIDLPNNYETPLPSVLLFGFHYDGQLVQSTGAPYWRGVLLAEEQVRAAADRAGSTLSRYRDQQAKCYREAVRTTNSRKEDKPV